MIWQQFEGFLHDQKVESIPTVGQVFDPAYHEVLSTVPKPVKYPTDALNPLRSSVAPAATVVVLGAATPKAFTVGAVV